MNLTISRTASAASSLRWRYVTVAAGLAIAAAAFTGLGTRADAPVAARSVSSAGAASVAALPAPERIVYIVGTEAHGANLSALAQAELLSQPVVVVADAARPEAYVYRAEDVPPGVQVIDLR